MLKKNFQVLLGCLFSSIIFAAGASQTIDFEPVRHQWLVAKYDLTQEAQVEAFDKLESETSQLLAFTQGAEHPQTAEAKMWHGAVLSTQASVIGGRKALRMVEEARDVLEASIEESPGIGDGFGQSVLAALYYRVPSWPIGFKDSRRAKSLLDDVLEANPDNIDAHFYYGDMLAKQKKYDAAKEHLSIVLAASPDSLSIKGRQSEALETIASMPTKHRV